MVLLKERIDRDTILQYRKEEDGIWLEGMDSRAARVQIPAYIAGMPVTGIYKKAFFNSRFLVSLTLPDTLVEIGDWAFAHCPRLTQVYLPHKAMKLGKSLFIGSERIEEICLMPESCGSEDVSVLLASAVTLLDAEYLVTTSEAGSDEWLRKWDSRLLEIVGRSDQEGFTKQILCGEEDYGSTDLGKYETERRKEKVRLCFTRLLHPCGIQERTKEALTAYLLEHTKGRNSEETWEVVRTEYAHKREYYEFFAKIGGVTVDNFDAMLESLGERQPELKAYLMRYKEEHLGYTDFFDSLSLDF